MSFEKGVAFVAGGERFCTKLRLELNGSGYAVGCACSVGRPVQKQDESNEPACGSAIVFNVEELGAEELSNAVIATAEKFGGIDLLVYSMPNSYGAEGLLLDLDEEDWDEAMKGAKAFFLLCKYALPYLINKEGSRVAVIGSFTPEPSLRLPDRAANSALRTALECVGEELSDYGIRVLYKNLSDLTLSDLID